MSSLTRFTPLPARARSAAALRYSSLRTAAGVAPRFRDQAQARSISSTSEKDMGPVQATKDTLKKADRVVSDVALKGLNKGEKARDTLRNDVGIANQEAKAKAENMQGEAAEYAGQGKGKAEQAVGYAKGKTQTALGEEKGRSTQNANVG